jgi:hypothetical protein
MGHKAGFLLAMLHQHGRKAVWGAASRGHEGHAQLWKFIATKAL